MYIAAPTGRLGLRGAAARRFATWPFALVGLRATSHTCDSLCVMPASRIKVSELHKQMGLSRPPRVIVLVNLAARSLQQIQIRRFCRVYPFPRRGCSSALKRAIERLGFFWFVRVPLSVTPFTQKGLCPSPRGLSWLTFRRVRYNNSGSILSVEYTPLNVESVRLLSGVR